MNEMAGAKAPDYSPSENSMSTSFQPYSLADLERLQYDDLQKKVVDEMLETVLKNESTFVQYDWSDSFVNSHDQTWALFGNTAYQLLSFRLIEESGTQFEYVPFLINGKMLREVPDEGKIGIAYLTRLTHWKGIEKLGNWSVGFQPLRWLRKDELQMSKDQILKKLLDEACLAQVDLLAPVERPSMAKRAPWGVSGPQECWSRSMPA